MENKTSPLVALADSWIEAANKIKEYDDEEKYPGFTGIVPAYKQIERVAFDTIIHRNGLRDAFLKLYDESKDEIEGDE